MKTMVVSFGDGPYQGIAETVVHRFQRLNDVEGLVLDIMQLPNNLVHPTWAKAWIWDLVPDDVERVIWIDADVVPVKPMMDLVPEFDVPFCGVLDHPRATRQCAEWHNEAVLQLAHYFNAGVFVAHRKTEAMFKEWQAEMLEPAVPYGDQTPLNLLLGKHYPANGLYVLPPICNWLGCFGLLPDDVRMAHLAGWTDAGARMTTLRLISLLETQGSAQQGQVERGAACAANW